MMIVWGTHDVHALNMRDDANWVLYADHEYEEASICLKVEDQTYDVSNEWEYLQGREFMPLNSYDILQFYSDVVMRVVKMVNEDNTRMINLEEVKEELLRTYWWPKWQAAGRVTDSF